MPVTINIRSEQNGDEEAIAHVTTKAFATAPYSNNTEALIIRDLRDEDALTLSFVAISDQRIIGHVSFSKVHIDGQNLNWYGLAPLSVDPDFQKQGIGGKLVLHGLEALKKIGAKGCVLLGEPDYYQRFGFKTLDGLTLEGVPPAYFMALPFDQSPPTGQVTYHPAFAKYG